MKRWLFRIVFLFSCGLMAVILAMWIRSYQVRDRLQIDMDGPSGAALAPPEVVSALIPKTATTTSQGLWYLHHRLEAESFEGSFCIRNFYLIDDRRIEPPSRIRNGPPPRIQWHTSARPSPMLLHVQRLGFGWGWPGRLSTAVMLPYWLFLIPAAVVPGIQFRRWYRARTRPRTGCCLACGYDLTGNTSGVCPECGTAISALCNLSDGASS